MKPYFLEPSLPVQVRDNGAYKLHLLSGTEPEGAVRRDMEVRIIKEFPGGGSGKILKSVLRKELAGI